MSARARDSKREREGEKERGREGERERGREPPAHAAQTSRSRARAHTHTHTGVGIDGRDGQGSGDGPASPLSVGCACEQGRTLRRACEGWERGEEVVVVEKEFMRSFEAGVRGLGAALAYTMAY